MTKEEEISSRSSDRLDSGHASRPSVPGLSVDPETLARWADCGLIGSSELRLDRGRRMSQPTGFSAFPPIVEQELPTVVARAVKDV